ncbi:LINE-1 reverse transcriptase like [Trifolium medium]|uniref:LINE-1 reverse transcriptase like n=1 Tax=Trifolium medium TaxID=97028 RepID=A0A392LX47_9FABA|nr:LINE-1 reverse transcriptase like [Trifolium medium]
MAIQETKMEVLSDSMVFSLWGGVDCNWVSSPAVGSSGGILSIWRKVNSSLLFTFIGDGFVGVCLEWGVNKKCCFVVNVYAKCEMAAKRRLWEDLSMSKRGFGDGLWCVVGDFNAVRRREERRGIGLLTPSLCSVERREFNSFLISLNLEDLNPVGGAFTWFHSNGVAMSRLDRMLVSEAWSSLWGNLTLRVLPRDVSDHCPLLLKSSNIVSGPKPFRFCNHWLSHLDFKKVVEECWGSKKFSGWMGYILKEKLKALKVSIKEWNRVEFGRLEESIGLIIANIKSLDSRGEIGLLSSLERKKEFHFLFESGERWLDSSTEIIEEVVNYFNLHFSSHPWVRPKLDGILFPMLSEGENRLLSEPFSLDEIEEVVKRSDGNKSPGPDGFNFSFIKAFWHLLKGEVRIMFDQFHGNACLPKGLLSYFITLIPKVPCPLHLGDFRPISLLGCLYKLIAKVLAARLAKVMDSVVATTQSAFIKGRNLVDGVMVVNEVVDLAKKSGRPCLILKVDFEKAYDSVDWGFLEYMLRRFGFCNKWVDWVKACVFAGNLSVLVNGSPTTEINIQRGLKQGDPLAPFLFLLVAEGFAGLMRSAGTKNLFKGFTVGNEGLEISHLQYADDTLCIGEATVENLWSLKAILRGFELASGLKVNFSKSCLIGVNVPSTFMENACSFLNCKRGAIPFSYLGLPVGANPRCSSTWEPVVDRLRKRLRSWCNRYVSLGGRIVLINSVLNSAPIFYLSFFKAPKVVIKQIIRIQREFLWGGVKGGKKISWVKWKDVCKPKSQGGLGVRDVGKVNLSLLIKWRWRLLQKEDALWKDILVAKYGTGVRHNVHWMDVSIPNRASGWWKNLCKIDIYEERSWFANNITRQVEKGDSTRFWKDCWLGVSPLCDRFPRLFSISSQKEAKLNDVRVVREGVARWEWAWRRRLFIWEEELLWGLTELLPLLVLSGEEDSWYWGLEEGGVFTVKSTYLMLGTVFDSGSEFSANELRVLHGMWKSPAPSKVLAFSWKLLRNRIPTRTSLAHRGIQVVGGSLDCVHCSGWEEDTPHLFLFCDFAAQVWNAIFRWLGVVIVMPPNLFLLLECLMGAAPNKKIGNGFSLIWHTTVWMLWRSRNDISFANGIKDSAKVVDDIKLLSWRWGMSRRRISICLFYEWCWDPGICLRR